MKNLLIYINPSGGFDFETNILARIQIENSLSLGWKREDICLITNFPYEYNGVKASIIPDSVFCQHDPASTKTTATYYLMKNGLMNRDIYWLHDFDAYQLEPITEEELEMDGFDMALCTYPRTTTIAFSSIFLRKSAKKIFKEIINLMMERKSIDQNCAQALISRRHPALRSGIKILNNTYNFLNFNVRKSYRNAHKPLKVIHFHPAWNKLDFFMRGKNKIGKVLMNDRLIQIFNNNGIR